MSRTLSKRLSSREATRTNPPSARPLYALSNKGVGATPHNSYCVSRNTQEDINLLDNIADRKENRKLSWQIASLATIIAGRQPFAGAQARLGTRKRATRAHGRVRKKDKQDRSGLFTPASVGMEGWNSEGRDAQH